MMDSKYEYDQNTDNNLIDYCDDVFKNTGYLRDVMIMMVNDDDDYD